MRDKDKYMLCDRQGEKYCATRTETDISSTVLPLRGASISMSINRAKF